MGERHEREEATQASAESPVVSRWAPVQGVSNAAMARLMTTSALRVHLAHATSSGNADAWAPDPQGLSSPRGLLRLHSTAGNRAVSQLLQRQGLPKRGGVDKYATMAGRLWIWLHGSAPHSREVKIAASLSRLTRAEVTRVENAYCQPRYEPDEEKRAEAGRGLTAINPYELREDVRRYLPNGERLAQWIESHSDLPRKVTAAEAERAQEKEVATRAARIFPESARRTLLQKLANPGRLPPRISGQEGTIVIGEKLAPDFVLWGKWLASHFDYLYKHGLVSPSAVAKDLAQPHGDLIMVWHVRTEVLNRWSRLTAWANQPTAGPVPSPSERKARGIVARQFRPALRDYRKIFDDTPSELSTHMRKIINIRLQTLEAWDMASPRAESGQ